VYQVEKLGEVTLTIEEKRKRKKKKIREISKAFK